MGRLLYIFIVYFAIYGVCKLSWPENYMYSSDRVHVLYSCRPITCVWTTPRPPQTHKMVQMLTRDDFVYSKWSMSLSMRIWCLCDGRFHQASQAPRGGGLGPLCGGLVAARAQVLRGPPRPQPMLWEGPMGCDGQALGAKWAWNGDLRPSGGCAPR